MAAKGPHVFDERGARHGSYPRYCQQCDGAAQREKSLWLKQRQRTTPDDLERVGSSEPILEGGLTCLGCGRVARAIEQNKLRQLLPSQQEGEFINNTLAGRQLKARCQLGGKLLARLPCIAAFCPSPSHQIRVQAKH